MTTIQDLSRMRFFFLDELIQKEFKVLQSRIETAKEEDDNFFVDSNKMLHLIGKYEPQLKSEMTKIVSYLTGLFDGEKFEKKVTSDLDTETFEFKGVVKYSELVFGIKGKVQLGEKAWISVLLNTTERKFYDVMSLIKALSQLESKIESIHEKANQGDEKTAASGNFQQSLKEFIEHGKDLMEQYFNKNKPNGKGYKWIYYLEPSVGGKYVKLVSGSMIVDLDSKYTNKNPEPKDFNSRSVWAFINKETGDVYKPASWNAPAKHARANIFDKETWKNVTAQGPNYLK